MSSGESARGAAISILHATGGNGRRQRAIEAVADRRCNGRARHNPIADGRGRRRCVRGAGREGADYRAVEEADTVPSLKTGSAPIRFSYRTQRTLASLA